MQVNGATFKIFYNDPEVWKEGYYHDDGQILIDGKCSMEHEIDPAACSDGAVVEFTSISIFNEDGDHIEDMSDAFDRWMSKQTSATALFSCPKECLDAVKAAIEAAGGKIIA